MLPDGTHKQSADGNPSAGLFVQSASVRALALFAFWTLLGALYSWQVALILERSNAGVTLRFLLTGPMAFWYIWGVFSLVIVRLTRRFPIERGRATVHVPVHVVSMVVLAFAHQIIYHLIHLMTQGQPATPAVLLTRSGSSFFSPIFTMNLVIYWVVVAVGHATLFYGRYRERERRAAELETRLVKAQLQTLTSQIHPHFLFNTLHAISSLMDDNAKEARQMMSRLSKLLRWTLDHGNDQEVTLQSELEMVRLYLDIEQVRFHDRLAVAIDVDPSLLGARVPAFLLQPLAENAVRHGIAHRTAKGTIRIEASCLNGRLVLHVQNDAGEKPDTHNNGIGLSNIRSRLQQLYGVHQSLEILPVTDGVTTVRVTMPFHETQQTVLP